MSSGAPILSILAQREPLWWTDGSVAMRDAGHLTLALTSGLGVLAERAGIQPHRIVGAVTEAVGAAFAEAQRAAGAKGLTAAETLSLVADAFQATLDAAAGS